MAKKKKLNKRNIVILISVILLIITIGIWYTNFRPNSIRNNHNIGVMCRPNGCFPEFNMQDWMFFEYRVDAFGNIINDKTTAIRTFVNDNNNGLTRLDSSFLKQLNPHLKDVDFDKEALKYINCKEYTKWVLYTGATEKISEKTWACVFDPNGIKEMDTYMKIITFKNKS